MPVDEKIVLLLTQIRTDLQAIKALLPRLAPNLVYPLGFYANFAWDAIGATVLERDRYGATLVSWAGRVYARRSPQNKYGEAIWFSRCTGKGEDGSNNSNNYERLVTFKPLRGDVEPLPEKVARHLTAISN